MPVSKLYLASASPRRKLLLAQILSDFAVISVDIDETPQPNEDPGQYVKRMALEKASAGQQLQGSKSAVLGGDTIVVLEDEILGKPDNEQHAQDMLQRLSGNTHQVFSAVALLTDGFEGVKSSVSSVSFAELPKEWIGTYVASGEPADKAGAYAIQGQAASWVTELTGSYSGIMGLPLYETRELLQQAGIIDLALKLQP